jgi:hypothetical protein
VKPLGGLELTGGLGDERPRGHDAPAVARQEAFRVRDEIPGELALVAGETQPDDLRKM